MPLTSETLKQLSAPFPKDRLGVKVQSQSKDRTKAMLVCYAQHTDVAARLDAVDPSWAAEITNEAWIGDTNYVRMRITICGVSREGVGDGNDPKSAASDALKRAAMLFGVGRYLYDTETVWVDYNEQRDKFRTWTLNDFHAALRTGQARVPTGPDEPPTGGGRAAGAPPAAGGHARVSPKPSSAGGVVRGRKAICDDLLDAADHLSLGDEGLRNWAFDDFKKPLEKMSDGELERLLIDLQTEIGRQGRVQHG